MISKYNTALLVLIFITLDGICTSTAKRMHGCKPRIGISTIDIPGCAKRRVASKGCDGHCMSSAIPKISGFGGFAMTCSCCSPIQSVTKYITLNCHKGPKTRTVALPMATKCKCRPC